MKHLRTDWASIQDTAPLRDELAALLARIASPHIDVTVDEIEAQLLSIVTDDLPEATGSSIRDDEPVFVLRAKGPVASAAVRHYAFEASIAGSDPRYVARVMDWADEMDRYATKHFPDTHAPDAPALLPVGA